MAVSGVHLDPSSVAGGREMCYMKGSIDAVLEKCKYYYVNEDSTPVLDENMRNVILGRAQAMASRGLRVLTMAYGYGSVEAAAPRNGSSRSSSPSGRSTPPSSMSTSNMVFVGFQAMYDPPRPGVSDSIGLLQSGGVQVVMITGDAEQTALSIAQKLGLRVGPTHGHGGGADHAMGGRGRTGSVASAAGASAYCLTGKAIDQMSEAQLKERVGSVSVFARTTPRHKMAIVKAFQSRGEVVAMTGDGGELLFFLPPAVRKKD